MGRRRCCSVRQCDGRSGYSVVSASLSFFSMLYEYGEWLNRMVENFRGGWKHLIRATGSEEVRESFMKSAPK